MADSKAIKLIRQKLKEFQTYSLFIEFELGIDENGNATYTFTTGKNKSYFMSVDNQRSGIDCANVITVTLAFAPEPSGTTVYDVNLYDLMLTLESVRSTVKYGYIFPDGEIVSSNKYEINISDYKIEIQNGLLIYTITGYSVACDFKESTLQFENQYSSHYTENTEETLGWRIIREIRETLTDFKENGSGYTILNPIGLCWFLLNGCGLLEEYDFVVDDSVIDHPPVDFARMGLKPKENSEDGEVLYDPNPVIDKHAGYSSIYLQSDWRVTDCYVDITSFNYSDVLYNRLKEILNAARCEGQEDMKSTTGEDNDGDGQDDKNLDLITYAYIIDDVISENNGKKKITFIALNTPEKQDSNNAKEEIIFNWMSGENDDIVLNFSPNFNGAVARAIVQGIGEDEKAAREKIQNEDNRGHHTARPVGKYWFTDNTGKIKPALNTVYTKVLKPISGNSTYKDQLSMATILSMFEQTSLYTANLTTIGIPTEINIQDTFIIIPLIYGKPHHTAGIYQVTKIHDILSSSGFTTDFELSRVGSSTKFKSSMMKLASNRQNRNSKNNGSDSTENFDFESDAGWQSFLSADYVNSHTQK